MTTPPLWLDRLANAVAAQMLAADAPAADGPDPAGPAAAGLAPIGCHFHESDGCWEVSLFISKTETVGGPLDGRATVSPFVVDVERLRDLFDEVRAMHWQAQPLGDSDELGAHLAIEGVYQGRKIALRILAAPPNRFAPGRTADVYRNRLCDRW